MFVIRKFVIGHFGRRPTVLLDFVGGQPALCVDGGLAAHARSGDGLAVSGVCHVACREDAIEVGGATEAVLELDVAVVVEFEA